MIKKEEKKGRMTLGLIDRYIHQRSKHDTMFQHAVQHESRQLDIAVKHLTERHRR